MKLDAWWSMLEARGHQVIDRQDAAGFTLWPYGGSSITVAVEADGTLPKPYRQQFFECEVEAEQVFRVMGCPRPHRDRWLELVSVQPPGYWRDFLAGPGSWLLSRLARFREVVAWADRGQPWSLLDCTTNRGWGMVVPTEAAPLFAAVAGAEASRPRLLPVADRRFADGVAACVLFASVSLRDCYLADIDAAEVYLAHHHDKVVVSIPGRGAREELLGELREASWLFTDVSGYGSSMDDEDEPEDGS